MENKTEIHLPPLPDFIKPGSSVYIGYGKGNPANKLIHIRAIVDGNYIVFRSWSKSKQDWIYQVEHAIHFGVLQEQGCLRLKQD